jgi:hypothetical protein
MTRFKIIGLALVAVFAISAMASASASALQWLIGGKGITKATAITSSGKLLLADLSAPSGGTYIECTGTDKGTVGPGATDEVTSITATKCSFQSGKNGACTASDEVTAAALHLPWKTELVSVSGVTRDKTTATSNPGWDVTCTVAGIIEVSDECTSANVAPAISNVAGGVDATFEASETASCTKGTSSSGMVIGPDLNESPSGGTLSVSAG